MKKTSKKYEPCVCGHQRLYHKEGVIGATVPIILAICTPCHMGKDKERAWHRFKLDGFAYIKLNAKSK